MNKTFICAMCQKSTNYSHGLKWNEKKYCLFCYSKAKEQCQEYDMSFLRKNLLKKGNE